MGRSTKDRRPSFGAILLYCMIALRALCTGVISIHETAISDPLFDSSFEGRLVVAAARHGIHARSTNLKEYRMIPYSFRVLKGL